LLEGTRQKIVIMWKPAETAPFDEDITVLISDGCRSPCWVVSGKKRPLAVVPRYDVIGRALVTGCRYPRTNASHVDHTDAGLAF
jgi:hypothetical protein